MNNIYFDNAATTFPKPKSVIDSLSNYYIYCGASAGRGGYSSSMEAGGIVYSARRKLSQLVGVKKPMHVIWTYNCTDALNLAIKGTVKKGWHVITSSMEHNSTIRVLKWLELKGVISLDIVIADERGVVSVCELKKLVNNNTRMVVINHASNVNGAIQDISQIGAYCRSCGIITIIDAAQSGGVVPINIKDMQVDMVAFAGHKSLYGVQGVGALVLSDEYDYKNLEPQRQGGTGSYSEQVTHPSFLPDCFEAGTLNIAGISALSSGIDFINERGLESIIKHKKELLKYFITESKLKIKGFNIIGENKDSVGVVIFNIGDFPISEIADTLSEKYGIMCRIGLQCSPLSHTTLGSFPYGGVRFSFGIFNTKNEIDIAVNALIEIIK